ncbi:hypothetical protein [Actinosynnema sp. NPDC023587]|uniref:hypothetical protein n=1 Tax=Actinosynnema sp. NPDC023587 TaxID=3154695 RepID=UPI0033F40E8D
MSMKQAVLRAGKFASVAAVLAGSAMLTAAPASASPNAEAQARPAAQAAAPEASWDCTITAYLGWRWEGWCTGYSGELRTITYCANGTSSTGDWIQPRPAAWFVYGNCSGSTVTSVDFQTRG